MLERLDQELVTLPAGGVILIGSSLGGFMAVEAAARHAGDTLHPITRLILLAPAIELQWERWDEIGPGGLERWRRDSRLEVFHHAYEEPRWLSYTFYEDAVRYAAAGRRLEIPMHILQDRHDESVDPSSVERFAHAQPLATLHLLDDEHQLKESLDFMWDEMRRSGIFPA